jgi:hypothetical protein
MSKDWKTLDTKEAMRKQRQQSEQTTSGNVGGFAVPLGGEPMRPAVPKPTPPYKKVETKKPKKKKG